MQIGRGIHDTSWIQLCQCVLTWLCTPYGRLDRANSYTFSVKSSLSGLLQYTHTHTHTHTRLPATWAATKIAAHTHTHTHTHTHVCLLHEQLQKLLHTQSHTHTQFICYMSNYKNCCEHTQSHTHTHFTCHIGCIVGHRGHPSIDYWRKHW